MEWQGKTTLVTGASSGIGAAFATALASRGSRLVLVARREDRLRQLAESLPAAPTGAHEVIAADLTQDGACQRIAGELRERGIAVDALVNNAGFATHGLFADTDAGRLSDEVELNVASLVRLTRLLAPGMVERRQGVVVNVASTAAFQPVPYMAVYGATKAFVLSFSEALWGELRPAGVQVLALCPGATETEFFGIAGEAASVGRRQAPEQVVATALRALDRDAPAVVSGRVNAVTAFAPRLLPRRVLIHVVRRTMAPRQ
jgi:uncharacterized protein